MFRRGRFACWKGNEYEISSRNRQIYLTSTDEAQLGNGFSAMDGTSASFVRPVTISELEDAYEIIPYALVKGHRFAVEGIDSRTGLLKLVTHNPFAAKKVAVQPYGSGTFMIEMSVEDVQLAEDRIPILGFEDRLA
ncbi:hypothetical protein [Sporosarcina trichiuri]|uniref:hypothetical protein n=1 Tax=Sporosarcina trichiuri TaxID=3056445 RepID=UPI0025B44789|nr:hypothetical protein [Sporosarcina sp. 0.2-SM1T-5]WJY26675.1 hypothetical protein QWT68_11390 [Sporosarcina sp. 0.2-SM1T-5]